MAASVTNSNRRVRTVRTVVWRGSAGDRRPYADLTGKPKVISRPKLCVIIPPFCLQVDLNSRLLPGHGSAEAVLFWVVFSLSSPSLLYHSTCAEQLTKQRDLDHQSTSLGAYAF